MHVFLLLQHQAIKGCSWEDINTGVSIASTTSKDGQTRPFAFTISATGEGETGQGTSSSSDCDVTWQFPPNYNTCAKRKMMLKGKAQLKTHRRKEDIVYFSAHFWWQWNLGKCLSKMLIWIIFSQWTIYFQLATGKGTTTLIIVLYTAEIFLFEFIHYIHDQLCLSVFLIHRTNASFII